MAPFNNDGITMSGYDNCTKPAPILIPDNNVTYVFSKHFLSLPPFFNIVILLLCVDLWLCLILL